MANSADTIEIATGPFLEVGAPQPLGANATSRGVNFAVYSAHATAIDLCLFDTADAPAETTRVPVGGKAQVGRGLDDLECQIP